MQDVTREMSPGTLFFLLITGCSTLLFFLPQPVLMAAAIIPFLLSLSAAVYFKRKIGGYTGDCLGAVQQIGEIGFLAGVTVILKLI